MKRTKREFKGSWGVVVLWGILLWPVAIVYYLMKCETIEIEEKSK